MEQFPELINGQVALLRADINTGIVLDEEYKYATKPDQRVYTIFNGIDEALGFTKQILVENKKIECVIYAFDQKVLHYLQPE